MRARKLFAALAASATATALLAGCSGGGEEESVSTAEEVVDGAHPADGEAADPERDPRIGTNTALAEKLITAEDLQGFDPNAKVSELDSETIVKYVEGREAIKDASEIFGGTCDSALETDVVVDSLLDDAVINRVSFPEGEGEAPKDSAGATTVALKPGKLDGFLDRSNYTGCQGAQAPSTEVPGVEAGNEPFTVTLGIAVEGLTGVDGVEGFREVRDIVKSNDAGETALSRNVIIHAYAGDTTIEISYSANSDGPDTNPITAVDNERLNEILSAQAKKLQDA